MFIKNLQGNYRRVDSASILAVDLLDSEWTLFVDSATDPNKLAEYASEQDARDALDELAALLGTTPAPGNPI
jgi:hypothetical protein